MLVSFSNQKINFSSVSLCFLIHPVVGWYNRPLTLLACVKITVKTGVLTSCGIHIYCGSWLFSQGPGFIDLTISTLILARSISVFHSFCYWVCSMCTLNPANYWLSLETSKSWSLCPDFGHDHSGSAYVALLLGVCFALWYRSSRINAELQLIHSQWINTPRNCISWHLE